MNTLRIAALRDAVAMLCGTVYAADLDDLIAECQRLEGALDVATRLLSLHDTQHALVQRAITRDALSDIPHSVARFHPHHHTLDSLEGA